MKKEDIEESAIEGEKVGAMTKLIDDHENMLEVPPVGEIVNGSIIDKSRNAMYVDLGQLGVGVIYGRDLFDDMDTFKKSKLGDTVQAMVQRFDNEDDLIELSLKSATKERSWGEIQRKLENGENFETEVLDANKGGLIVRVHGVSGFLPVSQLAPDNYPRVEGGDRNKILDRLNEIIGKGLKVKIIGADQDEEKLIVSEKAALSDEMSGVLDEISVDDVVKGTVSGVVDFGVFIKFDVQKKELEGLVHISELAWQRIDNPSDFVSVGDKIEAKVIGIDGLRISLSIKQLQNDPWRDVGENYKVGDKVKGEVLKVTPFGGFVKLDDEIHGLIHVSELPDKGQSDPESVLLIGKQQSFTIISLQADEHRLGLSLRKDAGKRKAGKKELAIAEDENDIEKTKKKTKSKTNVKKTDMTKTKVKKKSVSADSKKDTKAKKK